MEEELENGISLMEGILQNWANENKGKYHIFFPRCAKENDKDVVLFPIFEENKNGTLNLKVWAKYSLENYSLEDYFENEAEPEVENPVAKAQEPIDEELNFTMKKSEESIENNTKFENISPLEMSIEESLKFRAEERKRKMKDFNHKFNTDSLKKS